MSRGTTKALRRISPLSLVVLLGAILFLGVVVKAVVEERDRGAVILVHKRVVTKDIVEGRSLTFAYEVYNLGTSAAVSVQVDDQYGLANLKVLEGDSIITFEDIAPGARDRKTVTVHAETERIIPASRAVVSYTFLANGEEVTKSGVTTQVGPIEILSVEAYRRATSNYTKEFSLFALGATFPVLLPFISYVLLSSANDQAYGVGANSQRKKKQ